MRPSPRRSFIAAVALGLTLACGSDSTGPTDIESGHIDLDTSVPVKFTVGDTSRFYTFAVDGDSLYDVIVEPGTAGIYVNVFDSATGTNQAGTGLVNAATATYLRTSTVFRAPAYGASTIRVTASPYGSAATAEIKVHRVPAGPEHVATTITPGTPLTGESLEDLTDVDRFTFTGIEGQIIEPLITATGPADTLQVACVTIWPPAGGAALGFGIGIPGGSLFPLLSSGGRITLPSTGTYRAEVASGHSRCYSAPGLPYVGGYSVLLAQIDPLPETVSDSLSPGDSVTSEGIEQVGDIDRFTVHGTPGQQFVVFPRATGGNLKTRLDIAGHNVVITTSADTSLYSHPSGRITIPDSGKVTLKFSGFTDGYGGVTGPYRFQVYPVDPVPEYHGAAIALGDSVTDETLDQAGDIDRFTFTATAGQLVNVQLWAAAGLFQKDLSFQVRSAGGAAVSTLAGANGTDGDSVVRVTGRFTIPSTGTYTLEVLGASDTDPYDKGGYRFHLFAIDPAPETAPASLALGDSVLNERIDLPGDVDDYQIVLPSATGAVLSISQDSAAAGGDPVYAYLLDSTGADTITSIGAFPGATTETNGFGLAAGHYVLRVVGGYEGDDASSVMRGGYAVRTTKFEVGPETASDTLVFGDTVSTEAIDVHGDFDEYTFYGVTGQQVDLALEGAAGPGDYFHLWVAPPGAPPLIFLTAPTDPDSLGAHTTGRIDLPVTGWYTIRVTGPVGAYKIALTAANTAPEEVAATIAVGDTLTTEGLDFPGDADRFVLTGTPGEVVQLFFTPPTLPAPEDIAGYPTLDVIDLAADTAIKGLVGDDSAQTTGRFVIPASGQLGIRVQETLYSQFRECFASNCGTRYSYTGLYTLIPFRIDPAPESIPATIAIDDTVSGESIAPVGDIDEFHFTGASGATLSLYLKSEMPPQLAPGMVVQVIDTVTNTVLGSVSAAGSVPQTSGGFILPRSGDFLVRVYDSSDVGYGWVGAYRFVVRNGP